MTRQGNMRVVGARRVAAVMFRHPDCQWQGSSRLDCSQVIESVPVHGQWPLPFDGTVRVCSDHVWADRRAAARAGVLA